MEAERSEARVADVGRTVPTVQTINTAATVVMVNTVRSGQHHGTVPTNRPLGSCGTIFTGKGRFSFGKILRMAGYAKILQPLLATIRTDPA